ncbi:MAG: NADH-quinone oxidoreductase subunit N, partial [Gemmobacter sp.]|nr:NADH-quinone oxidoreductase subunit N [Gemmobacter sp.]
MTGTDFYIVLPEVLLAVYAMAALLFGVYTAKDRATGLLTWVTAGVMLALAFWIAASGEGARTAFGGMFNDDPFARFAKATILVSAAVVLVMCQDYMQRRGLGRFEYPVLVALAVVGMMMMVSAGDLIGLYVGLELQSLALYVIASIRRDSARSSEAGLK